MRLATRIYGNPNADKDILLIHGTGARAEMWQHQIDKLIELGYRCLVPDLRGHGESAEPFEIADLEVHMTDMLETINHLDLRAPAVFVGHSLGAIISLELAHRRPQLCQQILAIAMPAVVPKATSQAFRMFLGWPYACLRSSGWHKFMGWRSHVLIETERHALEQIMLNFSDINYCQNLPAAVCPVHFAVGRLDPVAPYFYVEQLHKSMPNSTLKIIEWAGHNCMDSQPKEFNQWFFGKLEPEALHSQNAFEPTH